MIAYLITDTCDSYVHAVFTSKADAEEFILDLCDEWVYEFMMCEDPMEAIGRDTWDWVNDYNYFLSDAGRTFYIQETILFMGEDVND